MRDDLAEPDGARRRRLNPNDVELTLDVRRMDVVGDDVAPDDVPQVTPDQALTDVGHPRSVGVDSDARCAITRQHGRREELHAPGYQSTELLQAFDRSLVGRCRSN